MVRARARVSVVGDKKIAKQLQRMATEAQGDVGDVLERGIRQIANEAAANAPVDTGKLANSLPAGVDKESALSWVMRDGTEYTLVQEYTHASKKSFIRRAVWNNEGEIVEGIKARIAKGG
jgi:hypothetical protein